MDTLANVEANEKAAFLAVLNHAAHLNGVTDAEVNFINDIADQFEVTDQEITFASQPRTEDEIIELSLYITNPKTQLNLIKELFFLGYSDGNLSDEEVIFISKLSNALGIADDVLERISQWVIQGIEWQEEGEQLFGE